MGTMMESPFWHRLQPLSTFPYKQTGLLPQTDRRTSRNKADQEKYYNIIKYFTLLFSSLLTHKHPRLAFNSIMDVEFKPNNNSITSESAPLIEPVDSASDQDLFMVPLKRPSPKLPSSRYRNVRPRSPPRPPATLKRTPQLPTEEQINQLIAMAYQNPPLSERAGDKMDAMVKTPPTTMFGSPMMSPEQNQGPSLSMVYHSPPMSSRNINDNLNSTGANSTPAIGGILSPNPSDDNHHPGKSSPNMASTTNDNPTTARNTSRSASPQQSTKASSVYDAPDDKKEAQPTTTTQLPPPIPPLSASRPAPSRPYNLSLTKANLGLALQLNPAQDSNLLAPPIDPNWALNPDSPMERASQMRATPDSAYDRARQMEIRRSEWKHIVYRFPVKGSGHWVIDCDLTESSHARLSDVAGRSSEGFEWNGDYELANIYRVLAQAHRKVGEEMRMERIGERKKGVTVQTAVAA
ncbi:hypothetical protein QC763_311190 [Podospora pseudopauciseta]|uniref:Ubiquitin-like protease family profile domain-containing protein n=1 Tax=Podospora pseudopauciseta TaxID=2093780 RepID=A0ABR0HI54_9PEZI|nr:hypothetical protein QC763_311190 [Podospora pseudopauciseta]